MKADTCWESFLHLSIAKQIPYLNLMEHEIHVDVFCILVLTNKLPN